MATYVNGAQIGSWGFSVTGGIFTTVTATDALDCCIQAFDVPYSVGYLYETNPNTGVTGCLILQFPTGCPANITSSYQAQVAAAGTYNVTVGNLGCGGTWTLATGSGIST